MEDTYKERERERERERGLVLYCNLLYSRRIKTEAKARLSLVFGGEEFIKFLAALAILPRTILTIG